MTTLIHTTVLALLASLSFVFVAAAPAEASHPKALLIAPGYDDYYLPKFGFESFNIHGVGERVTYVRWGGLASRLGLEPGDLLLSMNGFPLSYHGSWDDALHRAVSHGGWVRLKIRDVRTGFVVTRRTHVGGGVGPITPKFYAGNYAGPVTPHIVHHGGHFGHGHGPITAKSKVGPKHHNLNKTIHEIAKLFDKD